MRDDRERLKDNTRVAGDWHKQIAAGAAFTLLEYAVGLDEFAETALQCPAAKSKPSILQACSTAAIASPVLCGASRAAILSSSC